MYYGTSPYVPNKEGKTPLDYIYELEMTKTRSNYDIKALTKEPDKKISIHLLEVS